MESNEVSSAKLFDDFMIKEYVIARVKQMCTERGISQAVLADMMNVSRGFVGDAETPGSRAKYNLNHINILASIFECPFSDFFPDKPFPEEKKQKGLAVLDITYGKRILRIII